MVRLITHLRVTQPKQMHLSCLIITVMMRLVMRRVVMREIWEILQKRKKKKRITVNKMIYWFSRNVMLTLTQVHLQTRYYAYCLELQLILQL